MGVSNLQEGETNGQTEEQNTVIYDELKVMDSDVQTCYKNRRDKDRQLSHSLTLISAVSDYIMIPFYHILLPVKTNQCLSL